MAEYLFRHRLEQRTPWRGRIYSAGVSALVNQPADAATVSLMRNHDIDITSHRSTQLTKNRLRWADLILVMQRHHRSFVLDMDPAARGKTFLLGHWSNTEVYDPYKRGDAAINNTLQLIDDSLSIWIEKMGFNGTLLPSRYDNTNSHPHT
jgi:protein-tyrosine phosphatase